jgi:hypothetical protein
MKLRYKVKKYRSTQQFVGIPYIYRRRNLSEMIQYEREQREKRNSSKDSSRNRPLSK